MNKVKKGALSFAFLFLGCLANDSDNSFASFLQKRFSGRLYDVTRTVSPEQVELLVQAAQSAPSSYNMQPWNFIVCDREKHKAGYQNIFDSLVEFNQGWVKNVPLLVVIVASKISPHDATINRHAQYDSGAAAFAMMLQATSLGLMAHQMSGFDQDMLCASFGISDEYEPMAVMAIGYSLETRAPRKERKSLAENFFYGAWEK